MAMPRKRKTASRPPLLLKRTADVVARATGMPVVPDAMICTADVRRAGDGAVRPGKLTLTFDVYSTSNEEKAGWKF